MIKNLLQQGFILKSNGYYKYAIESFYKALEIDNSSEELLIEIAECYYLLNNEEYALNYIEQILEKKPDHIDSLKLLRRIFMDKNALAEAEQTSKNIYSISKNPSDLADLLNLLNKQHRYQEVLCFSSEMETCEIIYEKAYANLFLNRLNEAENLINELIIQENNNKNNLLKCKILFKSNKMEECIEIFNKINIDENDDDALNFAGLVKQYECDFKKAVEYFTKAVKISPKKDEYYYNCASTYFKIGDIRQAKKFYNLAITLAPENQNYHFALANLYYSEKQYKRAMEELNYDFFEARLLKAVILYESGYLAIAKKEFEKIIKEQPDNELINSYCTKIQEKLKI